MTWRTSGVSNSVSMETAWPSFMAAPLSSPRVETSFSAAALLSSSGSSPTSRFAPFLRTSAPSCAERPASLRKRVRRPWGGSLSSKSEESEGIGARRSNGGRAGAALATHPHPQGVPALECFQVERIHPKGGLVGGEGLGQPAGGAEGVPGGQVQQGVALRLRVAGEVAPAARLQGGDGEAGGEAAHHAIQVAQLRVVLHAPLQVAEHQERLGHLAEGTLDEGPLAGRQGEREQGLEPVAGVAGAGAHHVGVRVPGHAQHRVVVSGQPLAELAQHGLGAGVVLGGGGRRGLRGLLPREQPGEVLLEGGGGVAQLHAEARDHVPRPGLLGRHVAHHLAGAGQLAPGQPQQQRHVGEHGRWLVAGAQEEAGAAHALAGVLAHAQRAMHRHARVKKPAAGSGAGVRAGVREASSAARSSAAVAKRASGRLASARSSTAESEGGIPGRTSCGGRGACCRWATRISAALLPVKGAVPVSSR